LVSVDRSVGVERAAVAAEAADRLQCQYYLRLLTERCEEIDRRIATCQRAMARYESRGNVDDVRRCRRMMRVEQDEQDRLEGMIAAMHRRFPPPGVRPSSSARPQCQPSESAGPARWSGVSADLQSRRLHR
jgi:hypothetical protein